MGPEIILYVLVGLAALGAIWWFLRPQDALPPAKTPDALAPGKDRPEPKPEPALRPASKPAPKEIAPEPVALPKRDLSPALQLLAILQREGRLVDFLQEDVSGFSDADIGAAARVVHEGCTRGLKDLLQLVAIRREAEGDAVELPAGYDATTTRVTGNVTGEPPFRGTLAHHGWRVDELRLPALTEGHDPSIIAPAEVEL
ncbi:MAG: DUF2760 domain-containing protein [Myxococcales bacterium]|nr:DUF2760 domain-containing protein [Myxococcales bacterium]